MVAKMQIRGLEITKIVSVGSDGINFNGVVYLDDFSLRLNKNECKEILSDCEQSIRNILNRKILEQ